MKNALLPGALIFSLATLLVAYAELVIRGVIKERMKNSTEEKESKSVELPTVTSGIWQEPVRPE
jgi:DNA-binding transcriptional MocR family regulator